MEIAPEKQNIDSVFSKTQYFVDFYQRHYRWTDEPVFRLLDDLFYKFNEHYNSHLDANAKSVSKYPWYYLNTYVTNTVDGRVFVVDGQQRLTTLSLMLMKLFQMAKAHNSELRGWIELKIAGQSGRDKVFWMNHVDHKATQNALFKGDSDVTEETHVTAINMKQNYVTISEYLDGELQNQHRFETFVFFLLHRVVMVNLGVEQTDVPMVFEVINDRGIRLRPYEILKGKLLGQIDKDELDQEGYLELWEKQAASINAHNEDEFDEFFRFFLKAKFAETRSEGQRFDGEYHRTMFAEDVNQRLQLDHDPSGVKTFLRDSLSYYGSLYKKLLDASETRTDGLECVYYSKLLDLDAPFFLILSACRLRDSDEDAKIRTIAREIDRYYTLLQLQNSYDSNSFNDSLYLISADIRERAPECYREIFDSQLREAIAKSRNLPDPIPLSYLAFKQTSANLNSRFIRYFFGRIEEFLAKNMNLCPRHAIRDLVTRTGAKTGFHVEHILSRNDANLALFEQNEELFEQERNRLGGILLLKGKDNISSGNESFQDKLKTYANTLYWNETLLPDTYKSNLDFYAFRDRYDLELKPMDRFGSEELEIRHRLLFEIVKIIWA